MRKKPEEFKEKYIHIRIKESVKKEMEADAEADGHQTLTNFIMWLYAQFKKKK